MNKEVIRADEITVRMLNNFEKWLRDRGLERGVSLYLGAIQKLFKEFRLEYNDYDSDVVVIKNNPFEAYKVPRSTTKRKKRTLTKQELVSLRDYQCKNTKDEFARDMFLLSFYLVGMNTRDLYDCPAPVFGRIEYNRGKTKDRREDQAFISIKVEPEAQAIIDKYKGKKALLDLKDFVSFKQFNNILNKHLKNIALGLFFYMARHTWASMARNKCDVSKDDVAMALNHIDQVLKTTDTYIDPDWTIIDRANRKVLDYLSSCQQ
jgi:integrase